MNTLQLIKDATLYGGNVPTERIQEVRDFFKEIENKQLSMHAVISRLKKIETYDLKAELNEYNAQTPELYIEEEKMGENGDWIKKTELSSVINGL